MQVRKTAANVFIAYPPSSPLEHSQNSPLIDRQTDIFMAPHS